MAFLGTNELSDLRTHMAATLPGTCQIESNSPTKDATGSSEDSWTSRGAAIACRLSPAQFGAFAGITQEQLQEGQAWILSLEYDQAVANDDKVTYQSNVYRVERINTDESDLLLKRVYVVRWS